MSTAIRKWGNGNGIRLTRTDMDRAGLSVNDEVEVRAEKGRIVIVPIFRHKSLAERVAEFNEPYRAEETDWGSSAGKEDW